MLGGVDFSGPHLFTVRAARMCLLLLSNTHLGPWVNSAVDGQRRQDAGMHAALSGFLEGALHACAQVYPHGSTDALPYCTMGSGSLNAMAVFEDGYKEDLSREEACSCCHAAMDLMLHDPMGLPANAGNVLCRGQTVPTPPRCRKSFATGWL